MATDSFARNLSRRSFLTRNIFLALYLLRASSSSPLYGCGTNSVEGFFGKLSDILAAHKSVSISYSTVDNQATEREFLLSVSNFGVSELPLSPSTAAQLGGAATVTLPLALHTVTIFTYGLPGKLKIRLSPQLVAQIFSGAITAWDDPSIKALNPSLDTAALHGKPITGVVPAGWSASTLLFTQWLLRAAPGSWKLGSAGTVQWPSTFLQANGLPRVASLMKMHPGSITILDTSAGVHLGLTETYLQNSAGVFALASTADPYASLPTSLPPSTSVHAWSTVSLVDATGPHTWPVTGFVYVYARQNQIYSGTRGALLVSWLRVLMSPQSQKLVRYFGLFPLPATVLHQNGRAIDSMQLAPSLKPPF